MSKKHMVEIDNGCNFYPENHSRYPNYTLIVSSCEHKTVPALTSITLTEWGAGVTSNIKLPHFLATYT